MIGLSGPLRGFRPSATSWNVSGMWTPKPRSLSRHQQSIEEAGGAYGEVHGGKYVRLFLRGVSDKDDSSPRIQPSQRLPLPHAML